MTFYDDMAGTVTELVGDPEIGMACTLRRLTQTDVPSTGGVTETSADYSVRAVFPNRVRMFEPPATRVLAGKVKGIIPAEGLAIEPKPGDVLYLAATADETKRHAVVDVIPVNPGGTPLAYWLGLEA